MIARQEFVDELSLWNDTEDVRILARAVGLQSVAVRRSTGNGVVATISALAVAL